jgi:hypothetical protein
LTAAGGAAPAHGGEVAGAGAGAGYRGSEVTGVGQDRREGPRELAGGVPATRPRPKAGERQRESSGRVGITPARNPSRGEGESGTLRLGLAPAREGECYGPTRGLGMGPNWPDTTQGRRAGTAELLQGRNSHSKAELKEIEHGSEFLTSGRRSGRLGVASGGLDGGRRSPASASSEGRAREGVSLCEMRHGRESGCGRCSKESWGAWAGDVVGFLGVRAR